MWTTRAQATALAMVASKSFASLRHRPIHAKVLSTTHLRGRTSKPFVVSERLMISIVHSPMRLKAFRSLLSIAAIDEDMAQPWRERIDARISGAPSRS
jgi:hypothetical protein